MAKRDPRETIWGIDRVLEQTENPLHRQILENYRRHAILEVTGNGMEIFDPRMSIEQPVYYMNLDNQSVTLVGSEVEAFYGTLATSESTVMILEDEKLMVADWGFCSESIFNWYMPGRTVLEQGWQVDDPDAHYVARRFIAMVWRYDDQARLIGEHVYEHVAAREIVKIPEDEVVTIEEAREKMLPLLRPLPEFGHALA